ncbi:MAG: GTP 3',8-cyclase MoaA [Methylophilales bacterium]|jgi:cyclic pyranopterin phosphate synthase
MTMQLIDQFNRKVDYIRVSVTDRCDFRCVYCMSEKMTFLSKSAVLSLEEIERVIKVFSELGIKKVRLTGGEPLVRKGIDKLFQSIGKIKALDEITLTTNGSQLQSKAQMLKDSGVERINISLDSLNPFTFKKLTRTGDLNKVLDGIHAAIKVGFKKIKLNTVLMKKLNEEELYDLVDYAIKYYLDISFIEEMPLGETIYDRQSTSVNNNDILLKLKEKYSLSKTDISTGGPAAYFGIKNTQTKVGLISPHSHNFCENCNRVRITCKGELFLCLGHDTKIELMPLIRLNPNNDEPLKEAIINSMAIKPKSHNFNLADEQPSVVRFMSHTGG